MAGMKWVAVGLLSLASLALLVMGLVGAFQAPTDAALPHLVPMKVELWPGVAPATDEPPKRGAEREHAHKDEAAHKEDAAPAAAAVVTPPAPPPPPAPVVKPPPPPPPSKPTALVVADPEPAPAPKPPPAPAPTPAAAPAAAPAPTPAAKPAATKPAAAAAPSAPGAAPVPVVEGEGTLNLKAVGEADVYIDGRKAGKSPIEGKVVPAGNHRVRFDCYGSDGKPIRGVDQNVRVSADMDSDVDFNCL